VASTTLAEPLEWENSSLLQGDVPQAVRGLKEDEGKDLHVMTTGRDHHDLRPGRRAFHLGDHRGAASRTS